MPHNCIITEALTSTNGASNIYACKFLYMYQKIVFGMLFE